MIQLLESDLILCADDRIRRPADLLRQRLATVSDYAPAQGAKTLNLTVQTDEGEVQESFVLVPDGAEAAMRLLAQQPVPADDLAGVVEPDPEYGWSGTAQHPQLNGELMVSILYAYDGMPVFGVIIPPNSLNGLRRRFRVVRTIEQTDPDDGQTLLLAFITDYFCSVEAMMEASMNVEDPAIAPIVALGIGVTSMAGAVLQSQSAFSQIYHASLRMQRSFGDLLKEINQRNFDDSGDGQN